MFQFHARFSKILVPGLLGQIERMTLNIYNNSSNKIQVFSELMSQMSRKNTVRNFPVFEGLPGD